MTVKIAPMPSRQDSLVATMKVKVHAIAGIRGIPYDSHFLDLDGDYRV